MLDHGCRSISSLIWRLVYCLVLHFVIDKFNDRDRDIIFLQGFHIKIPNLVIIAPLTEETECLAWVAQTRKYCMIKSQVFGSL